MDARTLVWKSALSVVAIRPTVSAFRCFQTSLIGITVGRVGWKIKQPQPAVQAFDKCFCLLRNMSGASIDDQENRAFGAGDKALEKFNEDSGIDAALLLDHEPHLASRGDRRDEAHAMACAGGFNDRRFALLAPTTPRVVIRSHMGSIAKEDLRFFPLRKGFDLRVFLLEPLLDQGLVRAPARGAEASGK